MHCNPQPSTLNPTPYTLHPTPSTLNPEPEILNVGDRNRGIARESAGAPGSGGAAVDITRLISSNVLDQSCRHVLIQSCIIFCKVTRLTGGHARRRSRSRTRWRVGWLGWTWGSALDMDWYVLAQSCIRRPGEIHFCGLPPLKSPGFSACPLDFLRLQG